MSDEPRWAPLTEEDRRLSEQMDEDWRRALEEYRDVALPKTSRDKFTGAVGLDADGSKQPPLTPEQAAHNEEVRRRAREEAGLSHDEESGG